MENILTLINTILALIPTVTMAVPVMALLIDLGKRLKIVPDNYAGLASLLLNAAFWLGLYAAREIGVEAETTEVIKQLGLFAPAVAALVITMLGSKWFHENIALKLGIGYSYPDPKVGVSLPIRQSG